MTIKKKIKSKIILHTLPSSAEEQPILSLSVLKGFMTSHGYDVEIIYWNIILKSILNKFYKSIGLNIYSKINIDNKTLPFLLLLNDLYDDSISRNKIFSLLTSMKPEKLIEDRDYNDTCFYALKSALDKILTEETARFKKPDIILHGFTGRFLQWLPAIYFSKQFRNSGITSPFVIGGLDTEEEAASVVNISNEIDFAIWGEGEYPLLDLADVLKKNNKNIPCSNIPRIVYRKKNILTKGKNKDSQLFDFNLNMPDHSDYFNALKKYNKPDATIFIPIENARGCKWNRCKFCVLNMSYNSYREKPNEKIISEIKAVSEKYDIYNFTFTGSDFINRNSKSNIQLIDELLSLQNNSDDEFVFSCEVIPYKLPHELIKKLAMAGFLVQIGYEATGDRLLKKLNKQTRLADLILFLKMANRYGLPVKGLNILTGIPDETEADIIEAANNIPFLRFLLGEQGCEHSYNKLRIKKGAEYYNDLTEEQKESWTDNSIYHLFPVTLKDKLEDRFFLFSFCKNYSVYEQEWELFKKIDAYYTKNNFFYKFLEHNDGFLYREYCNDKLIKSIIFDQPEYINILANTTDKVVSFTELYNILKEKCPQLSKEHLLSCMEDLKNEYLLYYNESKSKILSIVEI